MYFLAARYSTGTRALRLVLSAYPAWLAAKSGVARMAMQQRVQKHASGRTGCREFGFGDLAVGVIVSSVVGQFGFLREEGSMSKEAPGKVALADEVKR